MPANFFYGIEFNQKSSLGKEKKGPDTRIGKTSIRKKGGHGLAHFLRRFAIRMWHDNPARHPITPVSTETEKMCEAAQVIFVEIVGPIIFSAGTKFPLAFSRRAGDNRCKSVAGRLSMLMSEDAVMIDQARALVEKQVRRVWLRLFFQVVVQSLVTCWAIGLLLAMFWFLLRPFAFADSDEIVRWTVPAVLLWLSTLAGLLLAWTRRPDCVASSLALDEKFGLRERVTTFLTLPADQLDSLAGQALLRDVTAHLTKLQVSTEFPLRIPLPQLLLPAGAFALALLAIVLEPMLGNLKFSSQIVAEERRQVVDAKEIQQKLDDIKKIVNQRNQEQQPKSEELKKMEEEFAKLLNQPLDAKNEDKIRERINEFRKLEDKMKERADGLQDKREKINRLKDQLEKLGLDKDKTLKDGPAKDFEEALRKGDLDKAKAALEKLVKDLKNGKLDEKQQKELAEQFKKLQDKLEKLANEDEFMQKLKKDLKEGKITKEDLAREMENFKHLQDLADILGELKEGLGKADGKEGGDKLDKLMKRFEELELTEKEIGDLLRDQEEIENALNLLMDGVDGDGDWLGGSGRPGRRRPIDPNDPNSKIVDERSRAKADLKGAQRITGYSRGGTFSKIPPQSVEGAFRQAAQDSPEALDRQRIPDDAAGITRGYFNKLGNQK
jgi:hypothetical protein